MNNFCSHCGVKSLKTQQFCPTCGTPAVVPEAQPYLINPKKLLLLGVLTAGFYDIFWQYKHWTYWKQNEGSNIRPLVRAIFSIIFVYPLMKRLYPQRAWQMAALYYVSYAAQFIQADWSIVFAFVSLIPLYYTQLHINDEHTSAQLPMRFSSRAIGYSILGLVVWASIIFGMLETS